MVVVVTTFAVGHLSFADTCLGAVEEREHSPSLLIVSQVELTCTAGTIVDRCTQGASSAEEENEGSKRR